MRCGRRRRPRAERLTLLAVLALSVGVAASATAQPGAGRRANRLAQHVFTLVRPGDSHPARTMWLRATVLESRHVPNRAFAGYVTQHAGGVTKVVAHFKVPNVKCSKEQRAVGPGAFLLTGPSDHEVFNAANVIIGCLNGIPAGFPVLLVNDREVNFSRPLAPGDSIVVQLTDDPGRQTVVQLSDLNPHHRYTLTMSGRGNIPNSQLVGYWASESVKTHTVLPPPDIGPTTFRSVSVDGRPLGSRAPIAYDMTDANRVVLISTSALMSAANDAFMCTRTGN